MVTSSLINYNVHDRLLGFLVPSRCLRQGTRKADPERVNEKVYRWKREDKLLR